MGLCACSLPAQPVPTAIAGLDHIPIAVRDLERAASDYRKLGFAIKPGRTHDNGIRNQHIKFPDGTELELIAAVQSQDALSASYVKHLGEGEGPAFLGLYAPEPKIAAHDLKSADFDFQDEGGTLTFHGPLSAIFLSQRQASPTDRPEHFAHANTARSLIGVWWASDDSGTQQRLMAALGIPTALRSVCMPEPTTVPVATLAEGTVAFVPARFQVVLGHAIAGAVIAVDDVVEAQKVMRANGGGGGRAAHHLMRRPRKPIPAAVLDARPLAGIAARLAAVGHPLVDIGADALFDFDQLIRPEVVRIGDDF